VIVRAVANHDDLEKRLIRLQFDLAVKLADQRAQFFKIPDTNLLQVGFAGSCRSITMRISSVDMGNVAVQANGFGSGRNLPFGGSQYDAGVRQVYFGDASGNGFVFQRLLDGSEVACRGSPGDNPAAPRQVGDDF